MKRTGLMLRVAAATAATVVLFFGALNAEPDPFWGAKRTYEDNVGRPSLRKRTLARERFALGTRDVRALEILAESYGKVDAPEDQERYLLASICTEHINGEETVPVYEKWRSGFKKDGDAWLWHRSLIVHLEHRGEADLFAVARGANKESAFLRAAAIEALAHERYSEAPVLGLIDELLPELPAKGQERAVLLESLISLLVSRGDKLGTSEFREPAAALIHLLDAKETLDRTKLVFARYLSELFETEQIWLNADPWLELLLNTGGGGSGAAGNDGRYAEPKKPKFIGIEAAGSRICYVIDMSDSMLIPLTKEEKEDLKKPKGPITGEGGGSDKKKEEKKRGRKGKGPEEDELDWDAINTRFDAAREFLKLSLRQLDKDKHFAVIFFGTDADLMKSCSGMMPASKGNIDKVIKELDGIKAGAKQKDRPHGVLRGNTNMHGGMHRAFKLRTKGMVGSYEYVNLDTFEDGCDTIFLLSDGVPSWDDWPGIDKRDPEDHTGDPETGTRHEEQDQLNFDGPYGQVRGAFDFLVDDIRRLNLFRKVEIHCIGIGEADVGLLQRIAQVGHGEARQIGSE